MGKSRKRRDFDRNANNRFVSGRFAAGPPTTVLERMRPPAMGAKPPLSEAGALPLPPNPEPLVLARPVITLPPRTKSKYPAKKVRRAPVGAIAAPSAQKVAADHPEPAPILAWAEVVDFAGGEVPFEPAPVARIVPEEPDRIGEALALALSLAVGALYTDEPLRAEAPVLAIVRDPVPPDPVLPRNAAVTVWKKNGALDVIGYWLRARTRRLSALLRFGRSGGEMARLRAENEALRRQLSALAAMQG